MNLDELRIQINDIDKKIVDLFVQRMQVAAKIAQAKAETNLPILDDKREKIVLQHVEEQAGTDFAPYAAMLYHTIFNLSRSYQQKQMEKETVPNKEMQKKEEKPLL